MKVRFVVVLSLFVIFGILLILPLKPTGFSVLRVGEDTLIIEKNWFCKSVNLSIIHNETKLSKKTFWKVATCLSILNITKASYDFKDVTELVKENDNLNFHIEQDFKIEKQEGKHFKLILITGQFKKLEFETSEHFENGDKILLHILDGTPSEIKICKSACPVTVSYTHLTLPTTPYV